MQTIHTNKHKQLFNTYSRCVTLKYGTCTFFFSIQSKKSGQNRRQLLLDSRVDPANYGTVVEMASFTAGGQDVICFATTRGKLCGLDLRSNRMVWELTNEAKYGTCTMHGTCSSRLSLIWMNGALTHSLVNVCAYMYMNSVLALHFVTRKDVILCAVCVVSL